LTSSIGDFEFEKPIKRVYKYTLKNGKNAADIQQHQPRGTIMNSTKLTGLAIFFLIILFAFHIIFRGLAAQSSAGVWLVSIFLGAIATYILKLTAIGDKSSS